MLSADDELNRIVVHSECPTLGVIMVCGRLRRMGYSVSRDRVVDHMPEN